MPSISTHERTAAVAAAAAEIASMRKRWNRKEEGQREGHAPGDD